MKDISPRTFQPQASTPDLSTPDFSTPDFSTMNFWIMGLKSSWLKSLGLKCHLSKVTGHFNPGLFNPRLQPHGSKIHGWRVRGWKVHGWKVWGWKVRSGSLGLKSPGLRCPSTILGRWITYFWFINQKIIWFWYESLNFGASKSLLKNRKFAKTSIVHWTGSTSNNNPAFFWSLENQGKVVGVNEISWMTDVLQYTVHTALCGGLNHKVIEVI